MQRGGLVAGDVDGLLARQGRTVPLNPAVRSVLDVRFHLAVLGLDGPVAGRPNLDRAIFGSVFQGCVLFAASAAVFATYAAVRVRQEIFMYGIVRGVILNALVRALGARIHVCQPKLRKKM